MCLSTTLENAAVYKALRRVYPKPDETHYAKVPRVPHTPIIKEFRVLAPVYATLGRRQPSRKYNFAILTGPIYAFGAYAPGKEMRPHLLMYEHQEMRHKFNPREWVPPAPLPEFTEKYYQRAREEMAGYIARTTAPLVMHKQFAISGEAIHAHMYRPTGHEPYVGQTPYGRMQSIYRPQWKLDNFGHDIFGRTKSMTVYLMLYVPITDIVATPVTSGDELALRALTIPKNWVDHIVFTRPYGGTADMAAGEFVERAKASRELFRNFFSRTPIVSLPHAVELAMQQEEHMNAQPTRKSRAKKK